MEFINRYTQTSWGQCVYVCLANAFDAPKIIEDCKDEKGLNWIATRRLVEKATPYTMHSLLSSHVPVGYYIPVFEVDTEFNTNEDLYAMFLVTIPSKRKGFTHCVLVIKENFNPTLIVLDPTKKLSRRISVREFFGEYQCSEVESFCNPEHGGTMFFNADYLKHLIHEQSDTRS